MATRRLSRYDVTRKKHLETTDPLRSYSLRIPGNLWQQTKYAAAAESLTHSEWLRTVLESASRGAKPPDPRGILEIHADADKLAAFQKLPAIFGHGSLVDLLQCLVDRAPTKAGK